MEAVSGVALTSENVVTLTVQNPARVGSLSGIWYKNAKLSAGFMRQFFNL